jgi:PTH1 family peptidyl-tRNA hydrolase
MMNRMIRLFVGLGNPGPEYEATRHNAGFWWTDALAEQLGARLVPERAYQALAARVTGVPGSDGPIWLLQPMTFMNRSGVSVAALARFFKIEPSQVLVVHDELDVQPGQAKLKFGGSSGGHNGLKDIQGMLGTADYWRLRLGIGHPGVKSEVIHYVLQKPSPAHREAIDKATEQSLKALPALLAGQMDKALAIIHAQPPRPKPPRPAPPPPADTAHGAMTRIKAGEGVPQVKPDSGNSASAGAPSQTPTDGGPP